MSAVDPLLPALKQAIEEGLQILSRHDGIHRLHSEMTALLCLEAVRPVNLCYAEEILKRMRVADRLGVYPVLLN